MLLLICDKLYLRFIYFHYQNSAEGMPFIGNHIENFLIHFLLNGGIRLQLSGLL
jgi:hypothetical protein